MIKGKKKYETESSMTSNERDFQNFSFDNISDTANISETFKQLAGSKENIELSLEVEIADSLKKLLSQPQNCTSRLLDVTIIRPSNEDTNVNRVETNTVAFGKDEIKDLLTIIEQQNEDKTRLNTERRSGTTREHKYVQQSHSPNNVQSESSKLKSDVKPTKRMNKHISARKNIGVKSAPPNMNTMRENSTIPEQKRKQTAKPQCVISNIRNVEARLLEICHPSVGPSQSFVDSVSTSTDAAYSQHRNDTSIGDGSNAHHVYTTAHTYDSLKKVLSCQNKHRSDIDKPDMPCLCHRCGMMGLLLETQKGPVLPNTSAWQSTHKNDTKNCSRSEPKRRHMVDLRNKHKQNDSALQQMHLRLKNLEERMVTHEEQSISRDYFKKIIGKLINYCRKANGASICNAADMRKDHSVQCAMKSPQANKQKDTKPQSEFKSKHAARDADSYCINPVLFDQNTKMPTRNDSNRRSYSDITEFFECKIQHVDRNEAEDDAEDNVTQKATLENFCKWGEELIKPGFDLKNKIMSLLDEKLETIVPKVKSEYNVKHDTRTKEHSAKSRNTTRQQKNNKPNEEEQCSRDVGKVNLPAGPAKKQYIPPAHCTCTFMNESRCPREKSNALDEATFLRNIADSKRNAKTYGNCVRCGFKKELVYLDSCSTSSPTTDMNVNRAKKRQEFPVDDFTSSGEANMQIPECDTGAYQPIYKKHEERIKAIYNKQRDTSCPSRRISVSNTPVQVAYVSPKVCDWHNDSLTSLNKIKLRDRETQNRSSEPKTTKTKLNVQDSIQEKLDCLRKLAISKNVDEEQLWNNIWSRVKDHAKTKHDTITIQIPTEAIYRLQKDKNEITEIELTVNDLCEIVDRSRQSKSSVYEVDTSSVSENRKRLQEIHKQLGVILNKNISKNTNR